VKREVNAAAKVVKGIVGLNERRRRIALKRVHRLHATNGNNTAKAAVADEKK
jgi:hypothetical protein